MLQFVHPVLQVNDQGGQAHAFHPSGTAGAFPPPSRPLFRALQRGQDKPRPHFVPEHGDQGRFLADAGAQELELVGLRLRVLKERPEGVQQGPAGVEFIALPGHEGLSVH